MAFLPLFVNNFPANNTIPCPKLNNVLPKVQQRIFKTNFKLYFSRQKNSFMNNSDFPTLHIKKLNTHI